MSELIGIVGPSGAGKSTSIFKNESIKIEGLPVEETFIINIASKPLPLRGWRKVFIPIDGKGEGNILASDDSAKIISALKFVSNNRPDIKYIILEDYQYVMAFEFMAKALEKGFEKFSVLAKHAFDILNTARTLRENLQVFVLTHSEEIQKDFETVRKMKTIGNLLDSKITLEGLFNVLLYTHTEWDDKSQKGHYYFITNRTNDYPSKSPIGMFDDIQIPNDLGYVSAKINEYNS
jgi:predicted amino acid-binding ACT domain protein